MAGPIDSIAAIFDTFQASVGMVAGKFGPAATVILTGAIAIRLTKTFFEAIFEDSIVSWVEEAIYLGIVGTILLTGIQKHGAIESAAWSAMGHVMEIMNTGSAAADGTGRGVLNQIYDSTIGTLGKLYEFAIAGTPPPEDCGFGEFACSVKATAEAMASNLLAVAMFAIVLIMMLVYMIIMMLQVFTGIFMVGIGLAFLPVGLAFYPVIESWAKNAVGMIASGIAHMGITSFLLSLVGTIIERLTADFAAGKYVILAGSESSARILDQTMGKATLLAVMAAVLIVLALSSAKAIGFATSIFGSVSGMIGPAKSGGMKPGNGNSGGGKATGGGSNAAGPSSSGGGGGGAVSQVAGAAGQTGAALATGGTSAAVSAGTQAAGTAAGSGAARAAGQGAKVGGGAVSSAAGAGDKSMAAATGGGGNASAGGASKSDGSGFDRPADTGGGGSNASAPGGTGTAAGSASAANASAGGVASGGASASAPAASTSSSGGGGASGSRVAGAMGAAKAGAKSAAGKAGAALGLPPAALAKHAAGKSAKLAKWYAHQIHR